MLSLLRKSVKILCESIRSWVFYAWGILNYNFYITWACLKCLFTLDVTLVGHTCQEFHLFLLDFPVY